MHQLTVAGNALNAAFYAVTGNGMHGDIIDLGAQELAQIPTYAFVVANLGIAAISGTLLALRSLPEQQKAADNDASAIDLPTS
jgi:hypothetical protein